jgi:hypothetical protein
MDNLISTIKEYAYDTENAEINYSLALIYDNMGQTSSAITYYHRASERTEDKNLAYECLLKCADCYERQGNRQHTVSILIKHALYLLPKRPEAYFILSRFNERKQEYVESYLLARIALEICDFTSPPLRTSVGYPGKYGLIFEQAVSAWHWGKGLESRKLFFDLYDNYSDVMSQEIANSVKNNLDTLGPRMWRDVHKKYDKTRYPQLKFKFDGANTIENNFSQVFQDMFILTCLNGKKNGTYLEVGSGPPFFGNNTALLEKQFGWTGAGIEFEQAVANDYIYHRKNRLLCTDALTVDYGKLLKEIAVNGVVDYLQLDCDPPKATFEILLMIPFEDYKFAVITYEHDHYLDASRACRRKSRAYLKSLGYELVVGNVSPNEDAPFEDWWVHPDLVDKETIEKLRSTGDVTVIEKYFFNK